MADKIVKGVMTIDGIAQVDYESLANLPTIDVVPTFGSRNAVQSNGVYNALSKKLDASDGKAADSKLLGGKAPEYYATAESVQLLSEEVDNNISTAITEINTSINEINEQINSEENGLDTKLDKDAQAVDSAKLDGQAPSYYAVKTEVMHNTGGAFTGAVTYTTLSGGNITSSGAITATGNITGAKVYGAVWNDYAEFRNATEEIEPGRIVCENGDDTVSLAVERLQPGALATSDTYGFAIGETAECKCPIAVAGRVLVYPYEDRNSYAPGDPVCAAPGGTVSKMTREEVVMYPDRIVGTVSAIPAYKTWSSDEIQVKNRIWIKI